MTRQLEHTDIINKQQKFPISIVCDALRTPENIGMCFRVAEGFGVEKIYTHYTSPNLENRIVKRTARNTFSQVLHETYTDFKTLIQQLKLEGNILIGIEITNNSIALQEFNFSNVKNLVFILGSERNGINNLNLVDYTVYVPMYGKNSSMNVIHSLSVTLYEATNQIKSITNT